ncbi:hypothetical protein [Roseibacillus persicicus]|nr:hypothetical protein [Roseibacillus persicicus]
MHLRLSDDEFQTLIDMVSLAGEVASLNQKPGSEDHLASFASLEDKILERAQAQGYADIIEVDPDTNNHRVTAEYQAQSYIQECIDEMRNEIFWEELSFRLAEREVIRAKGQDAYLSLSDEERMHVIAPRQQRFWEGFSKNGLDQVHLIAPPGQG